MPDCQGRYEWGWKPAGSALELALDKTVFPAAVGLQSQTAVGPQLSLGAKAMGCLDQRDQQSAANRANRRNLAQQIHGLVFPALGQQITPHLLTQNIQRVELLVVKFGATAHAGFHDLAESLRPMA